MLTAWAEADAIALRQFAVVPLLAVDSSALITVFSEKL
jgi:hypothetical protein